MIKILQTFKTYAFKRKSKFRIVLFIHFLFLISAIQAQNASLSGSVKDSVNGEGVIGANVFIKSLNKGAATDANGNFKLSNLPEGNYMVEISALGYTKQNKTVALTGNSNVNLAIQLATNAKLDEVVVIGYGTVKKEDLTGSVAVIEAKDFNKGVISSPDQLIQGKAPGVVITPSSGAPGSGGTIRIRGGASLNASNDPLIIIDGVPIENSFKVDGKSSIAGSPNALSMINANDIETYTILKDASAAAIYGNRASNGVIIITTKKGKTGKFRLSGNMVQSLQQRQNQVDVFTAAELRTIVKKNDPSLFNAQYLGKKNVDTDWQNEIYRTAHSQEYNVNFEGGIKKLPYRFSIGYLGQEGILKTGYLRRPTAALNLNPSFLNNTLTLAINLKGTIAYNRFANTDAIGSAIRFDPNKPVFADTSKFGGYYQWTDAAGNPNILAPKNPVALLNQKNDRSTVYRSIGNAQLDYKMPFLKGLRANVNFGYDLTKSNGNNDIDADAAGAFFAKGTKTTYEQFNRNTLFDGYLNYVTEIAAIKSVIDVTAGTGFQDFFRAIPGSETVNGLGFMTKAISDTSQNTLLSFYSRLNYTLLNQFLVTATIRRDGSSRFSKESRWGVFPSVALAWKINNAGFMKSVKGLSELKIRAGYGITGNQEIGRDYGYYANYLQGTDQVQYLFGNTPVPAFRSESYYADLRWEKTTTSNIALDYGFWKGRISGSIDAYLKNTSDLLNEVPVPAGSNLSNRVVANVGSVESKGLEASLNIIPVSRKNFTWQFGINGAYNENKVTKLTSVDDPEFKGIQVGGITGGTGSTIQIINIGSPINSFYIGEQIYSPSGLPKEGSLVPSQNPGNVRIYKAPNPTYTFGFNTRFTYKNWDLSTSLHGSQGNYLYNNVNSNFGNLNSMLQTNYVSNGVRDYLNTNFVKPQLFSDYYLEDASFIRMDHITLSYDFGQRLKTMNLRIAAIVQNAFVLTKYSGLDPEKFDGIDRDVYPKPRTYSIALNFSF